GVASVRSGAGRGGEHGAWCGRPYAFGAGARGDQPLADDGFEDDLGGAGQPTGLERRTRGRGGRRGEGGDGRDPSVVVRSAGWRGLGVVGVQGAGQAGAVRSAPAGREIAAWPLFRSGASGGSDSSCLIESRKVYLRTVVPTEWTDGQRRSWRILRMQS